MAATLQPWRKRSRARRAARSALLLVMALISLPAEGQRGIEELTISVSAGDVMWSLQTGNPLVPGRASNPGSNTVSVSTSWSNLQPGRTWIDVCAWFASGTAALMHEDPANLMDIPASAVRISVNGGPLTPVTNTVPFGPAGAGLCIARIHVTGGTRTGTQTDVLAFDIDLSAMPDLPADDYSGLLTIQVEATP